MIDNVSDDFPDPRQDEEGTPTPAGQPDQAAGPSGAASDQGKEKKETKRRLRDETEEPAEDAAESVIPDGIWDILGEPPLLHWEDPDTYWQLVECLAGDVKPKDTVEWIHVQDVADLTWELRRLRRMRVALISGGQPDASVKLLRPATGMDRADAPFRLEEVLRDQVRSMMRGDKDMTKVIRGLLSKSGGLDMSALTAASFVAQIDDLERLQRMESDVERRRDERLREIERWRFGFGERLRRAAERDITDLDPVEVVE